MFTLFIHISAKYFWPVLIHPQLWSWKSRRHYSRKYMWLPFRWRRWCPGACVRTIRRSASFWRGRNLHWPHPWGYQLVVRRCSRDWAQFLVLGIPACRMPLCTRLIWDTNRIWSYIATTLLEFTLSMVSCVHTFWAIPTVFMQCYVYYPNFSMLPKNIKDINLSSTNKAAWPEQRHAAINLGITYRLHPPPNTRNELF